MWALSFSAAGIPCVGLNGGPAFRHSEAVSFQTTTKDQAETDRWNAIGAEDSPAFDAMMTMHRIDIPGLETARRG